MSFTYPYARPAVTVDCIIYRKNTEGSNEIVLIKRGNEPYKDRWALPGGFIEMDEELEEAAKRELFEETGIDHNDLQQLFTVGTIGRDPRHRTISIIYAGVYNSETMEIKAGDDAKEAIWFAVSDLPQLAFDHIKIINKAFTEYIKNKI
jgi:8-oxo-dGTP diphosphatase